MYNGVKAMIRAELQLGSYNFSDDRMYRLQHEDIHVFESDMPEDMKKYAIYVTSFAIAQFNMSQKNEISKYVRDAFDGKYEKYWNCVVGESFDASLWRKDAHYIKLKNKEFGFVIFKE